MAITADQFDSLELTADEFDSLDLAADQFDNMSYVQFLELVKTRLDHPFPNSNNPEAMMEYIRSSHNTMNVMHQEMKESEGRAKKNRPKDIFIGFALGIISSLIASFLWSLIGN